jgi:4-amino-4-deoxy-L-arabinose transferase-like glycosyltransferase
MLSRYWDLLLIALLAACLLFTRLDSPLLEPDESRYAELPRLMLRSGDWLTPKLQGKPYNDKPPLVYWLIASSYMMIGVSIESARLVPAAAGWLTLILIYCWARFYFDRRVAAATALILLTMLGYLTMMRMLLLDGVLAFLVIASLLSGHHALMQNRHAGWWLVSAIFCGMGVLAKGPVAIVLVTPCLFALRWLDRRSTPMTFLDGVCYGIVVLVIAVPWYAAMMLTNESFGSEHFFRHHFRRFLDPAHHEQPFWYYLPALLIELLPWPLLLWSAARRWREWTGAERFVVFFCCLCFVFFSVAKAKLPTYLLPMLPMLAVMLGRQWLVIEWNRRWAWGIGSALVLLLIAISFRSWGFAYVLQVGSPYLDVISALMLLCIIGLLITLCYRMEWQPWSRHAIAAAAVFTICWITQRVIPDYAHATTIVDDCRQLMAIADREAIPFVAHRNSWDAVSFMLNRDEMEVYSSREWSSFVRWLEERPRCMIWMRDYEKRVESFTKSLPPELVVERVIDMGRVQGIILKKSNFMQTQFSSPMPIEEE